METVAILNHLIENNQVLAYVVIFFGLIFEGEVILIITGILANLGALNFWFALVFILSGALVKALCGYQLGKWLYVKYNHSQFLQYIEKKVSYIMPHFKESPLRSIFFSKFIMGVNYMVIIFAGYSRIDFKKYFRTEVLSTVIWAPLLLSLGYFFSYTALNITREIAKFTLIIVFLIIGFLIVDKLIATIYEIFENLHHDHKQ